MRTAGAGGQVTEVAVNIYETLGLLAAGGNDANLRYGVTSPDGVGGFMWRASLTRACIPASYQSMSSKGSALHAVSPGNSTGLSHVLWGGNTCW